MFHLNFSKSVFIRVIRISFFRVISRHFAVKKNLSTPSPSPKLSATSNES